MLKFNKEDSNTNALTLSKACRGNRLMAALSQGFPTGGIQTICSPRELFK